MFALWFCMIARDSPLATTFAGSWVTLVWLAGQRAGLGLTGPPPTSQHPLGNAIIDLGNSRRKSVGFGLGVSGSV